MWEHYRDWIYRWETRLNQKDTNRVVRPLEWGLEWTAAWPCVNGHYPRPTVSAEQYISDLNQALVGRGDEFFDYRTPSDFRLEGDFLCFTSPVETPVAVNNLVRAKWFRAGRRKAVVVLPQWNADAGSHNALCRVFNVLGISALRLSLPYHDFRKPQETERADYAVSSNIGRTLDAGRQAVVDARSCLDWLEEQGYGKLGIVGTSLGSCYAFLASAHDPRLGVNVFNHCSSTFGDVVWTGQSTRHVRLGLENHLSQDRLRRLWLAISPIAYVEKYARWPKKSLAIYGRYDLTFLPEYSHQFIDALARLNLEPKVSVLPCGHYTTAETPFKFLDAYYMASFLESAFNAD
jgi:hypothetical protein